MTFATTNRQAVFINTVLILFAIFAILLVTPASAKGVNLGDMDGMIALELCRTSTNPNKNPGDQDNFAQSWGNSCCSKAEGYCIECLRGKNYCTKYPYFKRPDFSKNRPKANTGGKFSNPKGTRKNVRDHRKQRAPRGNIFTPRN